MQCGLLNPHAELALMGGATTFEQKWKRFNFMRFVWQWQTRRKAQYSINGQYALGPLRSEQVPSGLAVLRAVGRKGRPTGVDPSPADVAFLARCCRSELASNYCELRGAALTNTRNAVPSWKLASLVENRKPARLTRQSHWRRAFII